MDKYRYQAEYEDSYEDKKEKLEEILRGAVEKGVCIAFSGGVDSSVILKAAAAVQKKQGGSVFAVLFDTFLHPKEDEAAARQVALECGSDFAVIPVNELENPAILDNPPDRCYHCKHFLFSRLRQFADAHGCPVLMDGTNADDLHAYRPGLKALAELSVVSPLAQAGFTKAEVRRLAKEYGISTAGRPSNSCLATRLPYGQRLWRPLLEKIAAGENCLVKLGFHSVRIRLHGPVARIEIAPEQFASFLVLREEIVARLKELGFIYITLDVEGFRSGSMDLNLQTGLQD